MDAIADKTFITEPGNRHLSEDSPSLLTIIIETSPLSWHRIADKVQLKEMLESLVVYMNAHLALNNSNQIAIIANHYNFARFLYPMEQPKEGIQFGNMYRQFRVVDEGLMNSLYELFAQEIPLHGQEITNHLSNALSMGLTFINKRQILDANLKAKILVINLSKDIQMNYTTIMNSIFAAQKMKIVIDVVQIGQEDSTFLQQATDSTQGVYLKVDNLHGMIQFFTTCLFIDPSIRNIVTKPNKGDIDFRASCYITGAIVDMGYVCSVCLCILSVVPDDGGCPACGVKFDEHVIMRLKRKPVVRKKRVKGV